MPRPELGTPKVGDTILVTYGNHSKRMTSVEMTITKVGRVWLTVNSAVGNERAWTHTERRFRMDTQNGDSRTGTSSYFRTPAQAAWDRTLDAATVYLREVAGLDIRRDGPFFADGDLTMSLANLLRDAEASWRPAAPE